MLIVIFALSIAVRFVYAAKHYIHRSHLNETYYGKTRFAVDNFIDHHRMNLLLRMLKKNKDHFYEAPEKCFILEGHKQQALFETIIEEQDRNKMELQTCRVNQDDGRSCYDRALYVLKTNTNRYNSAAARELREELEAYIYIRDKIFEYASEVFNTTVVPSMDSDGVVYFYYRPESPTLMTINGRDYIRGPHIDYYRIRGCLDRPLTYDKPEIYHNIIRRYSATLYFDDIPESSGGVFEWYDFPNNHKLPPEEGYLHKNPSSGDKKLKPIVTIYSPSFADPIRN